MMKMTKQEGFTLVELAIVLVIVGLLVGGILKGQKLLLNAKVTATVAQIKGIEAAVTNFRDVYGGLPGDLKNSLVKIPGCNGGTPSATAYCTTNANGSIGESDWDMQTFQSATVGDCNTTGAACDQPQETLLFWYSLQMAGLISGITNEIVVPTGGGTGVANVMHAFGKTIPASKIGGGFWAGTSTNGVLGTSDSANGTKYSLFGAVITLAKAPGGLAADANKNLTFATRTVAVTPAVAANIDRKLDDGLPATGSVQAYGDPTNCFGGAGSNAYRESSTTLDCGVHIRVQK